LSRFYAIMRQISAPVAQVDRATDDPLSPVAPEIF
jgi:hypothetical protein